MDEISVFDVGRDLAQLWALLITFFAWFAGIAFLRIRVGIDVSLWLVVIVCALMSIAFLLADYIDMQDWAGAPKTTGNNAHG